MYEDKFPNLETKSKGLAIISIKDNANVFVAYPNFGYGLTVNENTRVGYLTGRFVTEDGNNYVQVVFESEITDDEGRKYNYGCVDAKEYRTAAMGSHSGAKSLIDGLIANNKTILENNLLCAGMMQYMTDNKISVPTDFKKRLYGLQSRLTARNEKLLTSPFLDAKQTGTPPGFTKYSGSLNSFMSNTEISGIGIAPIVIYIIVSVVFTLLVSAILYLIFKPDYTDSKADLKVSEDLTKALATLSPEARAAVLADLNGQVDEAYIRGKMDGSGAGILKTAGYLAAGFLGFTVIDKFLSKREK
ncbi:MAG: hypothetical protein ACOYMD_11800 [Paludibacter sp.]